MGPYELGIMLQQTSAEYNRQAVEVDLTSGMGSVLQRAGRRASEGPLTAGRTTRFLSTLAEAEEGVGSHAEFRCPCGFGMRGCRHGSA